MEIEDIKERLLRELSVRELRLVSCPDSLSKCKTDELLWFSAEQSTKSKDKPLVAGLKPRSSNTPDAVVSEYHNRFLAALHAVGIPRSAIHAHYLFVGRRKTRPTFVAQIRKSTFQGLVRPA